MYLKKLRYPVPGWFSWVWMEGKRDTEGDTQCTVGHTSFLHYYVGCITNFASGCYSLDVQLKTYLYNEEWMLNRYPYEAPRICAYMDPRTTPRFSASRLFWFAKGPEYASLNLVLHHWTPSPPSSHPHQHHTECHRVEFYGFTIHLVWFYHRGTVIPTQSTAGIDQVGIHIISVLGLGTYLDENTVSVGWSLGTTCCKKEGLQKMDVGKRPRMIYKSMGMWQLAPFSPSQKRRAEVWPTDEHLTC